MTPWQILGVPRGSDRDAIRRAYARKLKGVNPEDDPQGFMALREAHDAALQQLKWQLHWDEMEESPPAAAAVAPGPDEPPVGELAAFPPRPQPPTPASAEELALAAERSDVVDRQSALIAAIAAGPEAQVAALDHLLAAPALAGIRDRATVEAWLAQIIASHLPASDPLVLPAIAALGWADLAVDRRHLHIAAILQRRDEGEFVARIARPHTDLHIGYLALANPKSPGWWRHVTALFTAAPAQTRTIIGLADGPMPGIADWLQPAALAWWRDYHAVPRLRLWMILLLIPLASLAIAGTLDAAHWPQPVIAGLSLLALAAPWAFVRLLRWRQAWHADWQRPQWQFMLWMYLLPALPVVAAVWPPIAGILPLWLVIVVAALVLQLVGLETLQPEGSGTLVPGLVRAWPAWAFLWVMLIGAPAAEGGAAVRALLVPAMAIGWWQGGDALAWGLERRLGRHGITMLVAAGLAITGVALALALLPADAVDLVGRGLCLLALALLAQLVAFRLAQGWWQLLPLAGLAVVALALFHLVGLVDPTLPTVHDMVAGLGPDLFIDPKTNLPRSGLMLALFIGGGAAWGATTGRKIAWQVRLVFILFGLVLILRPLVDAPSPPPKSLASQPRAIGSIGDWLKQAPRTASRKPGDYRFSVDLAVAANGQVVSCVVKQKSGVPEIDAWLCPQLVVRARFHPGLDARGQPAPAIVPITGSWRIAAGPAQITAPPAPPRPEPVITCPAATGTGPMVAEPCMRGSWIGDGDYPRAALAAGHGGTVRYLLTVNPHGRVDRCTVEGSSGHRDLDDGTCALLVRRARFVPARDVDGSAMPWDYRASIIWQLAGT